jgi:hypothetical protein
MPPPPAADCPDTGEHFVEPSLVRRLTHHQYNRAVESLFGDTSSPADNFPAASLEGGYDNQSSAQFVGPDMSERWEIAARAVAAKAALNANTVMSCGGAPLDTCVMSAVPTLAKRLFRRPLTEPEQQKYLAFYEQNRATDTAERAFELTLTAMLMSPNFLFLVERGVRQANGLYALTGHELASRLAILLWNEPPDEGLLAAAEAGELATPEGLATRAELMLKDERATATIMDFHAQWFGLRSAGTLELPEGVPDTARDAAKAEVEHFIQDWYSAQGGRIQDLFTSTKAWVDADLGKLYGLNLAGGPQLVDLPAGERSGLFTRVLFLGTHANPASRGDFVLKQALCTHLPPPPQLTANDMLPRQPTETTRQHFERHATNPCAASCHGFMDPVGFLFENYDRTGSWRTEENGQPINASTVVNTAKADVDGPANGAIEFSQRLATSRTLSDCLAAHWFQYANGRQPGSHDRCSVRSTQERLAASSGDVRQLLIGLTQVDSFRFVRKTGL